MSNHSQHEDEESLSDHLAIHFTRNGDLNALLTFNFLDQHFITTVELAEAKHLYKKLSESRFWTQSEDKRTLIALNAQINRRCPRCGGPGYIYKFRHIQEGICFLCWGSGGRWGTEDSAGAVRDFSSACKSEELGDLYERVQLSLIEGFKKAREDEELKRKLRRMKSSPDAMLKWKKFESAVAEELSKNDLKHNHPQKS